MGPVRHAWLALVLALGTSSVAAAQSLPAAERAPRVLFLAVDSDVAVESAAIDTVDEAISTLPALAQWARPTSSCDPASADALAEQTGCLASVECVRRLATRCNADYLVHASVHRGESSERVEVAIRVIDGRRGTASVEEHVEANVGVALERAMRRGVERVAGGGWLSGRLEVRGPASGMGVRIDGHDVGVAPVAAARLAVGYHEIELLAEGRVAYRGEVEVEPGVTSIVRASAGSTDRYVVSVTRQDARAADRATTFAEAHRTRGTIAMGTSEDEARAVRATGVGLVVFEDRDPRRDVLIGRGRVAPTYHRGGVGASLRVDFQ